MKKTAETMLRPATLSETLPYAISYLKDLEHAIKTKQANEYEVGLSLASIIDMLEHPENFTLFLLRIMRGPEDGSYYKQAFALQVQ